MAKRGRVKTEPEHYWMSKPVYMLTPEGARMMRDGSWPPHDPLVKHPEVKGCTPDRASPASPRDQLSDQHAPEGAYHMASYILRNIDPELWRQVKTQAASDTMTVKAVIESLLREWLARRAADARRAAGS